MDSIFVVILLFALYVVPEILRRRRKPSTYKYPEFPTPEPEQQQAPGRIIEESRPSLVKTAVSLSPALQTGAAMPQMTAMPVSESTEQITFDNLAYGIVMAEILGPPKAARGRFTQRRC